MSIPKIKEVKEALEQMKNDLVLVNDQILNKETGNPVEIVDTNHKGYKRIVYDDIRFSYHRVVFWLHAGLWPDVVDHIDRNTSNNHPSNLRAATFSQNGANRNNERPTASGARGVTLLHRKNKDVYRVRIMYQGIHYHVGYFDSLEEACYAYDVFAKVCFGEFANLHNEDLFYERVGDKLDEIKAAFQ